MPKLITLAKPITMQLHRMHSDAARNEAFQVKVIAIHTNLDLGENDKQPFLETLANGVIFADSEQNTLYALSSLGGSQTVKLRLTNINSITDAAALI